MSKNPIKTKQYLVKELQELSYINAYGQRICSDGDLIRIANIRHDMHVTNSFGEWLEKLDEIKLLSVDLEQLLPVIYPTDAPTCDNDDCFGDCDECQRLEFEFLEEKKEEVNSIIESFLRSIEEEFDLDENIVAPTGLAREDWIYRQ